MQRHQFHHDGLGLSCLDTGQDAPLHPRPDRFSSRNGALALHALMRPVAVLM